MIFGKFAAIGGALMLGVLWPFATGQIAQFFYEKEMSLFESNYIELKQVDYDRGYLSSEIITEVALKGSLLEAKIGSGEATSYLVVTQLNHGLYGISGESTLDEIKENTAETALRDPVPISHSNFSVNLLGNAKIEMNLNPFQALVNNRQIKSTAATLKGDLKRDGQIFFQLTVPDFVIEDSQEKLAFNQLVLSGKGKTQNKIWIGRQNLSAASVTFESAVNGDWQIQQGNINFENELHKSSKESKNEDLWRVNTLTFASAEQVTGNRDQLNAKNLQFGIKLEDLDYLSLLTIMHLDDNLTENEWQFVESSLKKLITKGFKFSVPIDFVVDQGSVNGLINLNIEKGAELASNDLDQVLEKVKGDMTLSLPNTLIKTEPAFFDILEQQGFLVNKDDITQINFSLAGDELISSTGKRFSYGEFLPLVM